MQWKCLPYSVKRRRRLQEYILPMSESFTSLSDEKLDELIKDKNYDFLQSGYRMVLGVLRSRVTFNSVGASVLRSFTDT